MGQSKGKSNLMGTVIPRTLGADEPQASLSSRCFGKHLAHLTRKPGLLYPLQGHLLHSLPVSHPLLGKFHFQMAKVEPGEEKVPTGSSGDQPSALVMPAGSLFSIILESVRQDEAGGSECFWWIDGLGVCRGGRRALPMVGWGQASEVRGGHSPAFAVEGRVKASRNRRGCIFSGRLLRSAVLVLSLCSLLVPRRGSRCRWAH